MNDYITALKEKGVTVVKDDKTGKYSVSIQVTATGEFDGTEEMFQNDNPFYKDIDEAAEFMRSQLINKIYLFTSLGDAGTNLEVYSLLNEYKTTGNYNPIIRLKEMFRYKLPPNVLDKQTTDEYNRVMNEVYKKVSNKEYKDIVDPDERWLYEGYQLDYY